MSNVQFAKNIYAAFGRGDIPTVLAAFHPEIEWRQAEGNPYQPTGAAWVGPQAVQSSSCGSVRSGKVSRSPCIRSTTPANTW